MASPAILKIDIIADATKAAAALSKTESAAKSTGGAFSGMGKAVGAAVGTAAIIGFGKASFAAAEESAQATARLEQVFASMGDTTGEAAKQAEKYASALSKKIAVDDEAIMAAQAQLATFGAVSDETARAAGVFDRATAAAADLAAAGFGSLDANSVQLGKALQDPTKGLAALAKSGVTFTQSQKDQIKAMQESGDLLGAQKMVLKAVESQVKGTAAATATGSEKMAIAFGEVQEQVGAKLMPVMSKVTDLFVKYSDILLPLGAVLIGVVVAVKAFALAQQVASAATAVWSGIQTVFNLIMAANPIVLVVLAIAALVAAVILAYKNVEGFRNLVDAAFKVIVAAFDTIKDAAETVFNFVKNNWPLLLAILTGPFGLAVLAVVKNFDTIKGAVLAVYNWIKDNWPLLLAILTGPFGLAVLAVVKNFDSIKAAATAVWEWVTDKFQAIADFISNLAHSIGGFVTSFVNAIKGPLNVLLRAWNRLEFTIPRVEIDLPGPLGSIGAGPWTVGLPDVPLLASGGMVARTGLAVVHAGEQFSGVGNRFGGGGNVTINVTTTGLGADAPSIQRAVANALRGYTARNGPLDIPVRGVA